MARVGFDEIHVIVGDGGQFGLRPYGRLAADGMLRSAFGRSSVRAVAGQVEHLNLVLVFDQPSLDRLAMMDAKIAEDQEEFFLAHCPSATNAVKYSISFSSLKRHR